LQAVQGLGIFGQQHVETFLREVAAQQVANAGIVIYNDDAVRAGVGVGAHERLPICNSGDSDGRIRAKTGC